MVQPEQSASGTVRGCRGESGWDAMPKEERVRTAAAEETKGNDGTLGDGFIETSQPHSQGSKSRSGIRLHDQALKMSTLERKQF